MTLFLLWGAASSAWALSEADTLRSLTRWALDAVLLVIVATSVHRWSAFRAVAGAIALAAVLSTFAGLGGGVEGRLGGALGDPNVQAAALVPAILLAGALALDSRDVRRLAWASVSAACLVGLLATGSRGGLIGLAVACVTMVAVGGRWRRPVATGLAVAAVAGAGYVTLAAPQTIRDRLGSITSSAATDGGAGRTDIWRVGTRTFRSAPVEGVGLGNYSAAVVNHLNEPGLIRRPDVVVGQTKVAHNTYLEILTETGVVGFLLFLGLICSALAALAGAIRGPAGDAPGSGPVLRALFAAAVGVLAANFFISGQYETVLWVVLGLSLASASLAWSPVPAARLRSRPTTAPVLAAGQP